MKNKFITFEGGEGAGKSTQVKKLAEFLRSKGEEVVTTREPGGTENAESIRELLVNGAVNKWDGMSEVLLNFAARNEHVTKVIKPALASGKWVISDRFFDSTIVYQGYGQGQDITKIRQIQNAVLGDFAPDFTFLLDLDVETALSRANSRGEVNRYEKMGLEFHHKIRGGFLDLAGQDGRFKIINSSKTPEEVYIEITKHINI